MTITWGDVSFDGPYSVSAWEPPYRAAVYAIMMKPDPISKPSTFRMLYFGESSNLSERGFFRSHHKYNCWIQHAGSEDNLYIGTHLMPDSSQEERTRVEQGLISRFDPACNR
jgi:hypothetical protein